MHTSPQKMIPEVPARQWVCSLPWRLRVLMGYDRRLCADVLKAFVVEFSRALRRRPKKMVGLSAQTRAHTGAVSVVQRGDSALRLNVHFNRVSGESEATYSHAHRTFSPEGSNMWCQLAWENDSYQVTSSKGASLRSYEGTSHSCLLFPPLRYGNATCSCSTASTSATRRASSSSTRSRRRRPTR